MTKSIAVINAGSSSIKFAIYEASDNERCLFQDRSRVSALSRISRSLTLLALGSRSGASTRTASTTARPRARSSRLGAHLLKGGPVIGFGHRVVHGGLTTRRLCG